MESKPANTLPLATRLCLQMSIAFKVSSGKAAYHATGSPVLRSLSTSDTHAAKGTSSCSEKATISAAVVVVYFGRAEHRKHNCTASRYFRLERFLTLLVRWQLGLGNRGSCVLRLEARSYRGDRDEVPIWTAFLTKYKDNGDRDIVNLESRGVVSMSRYWKAIETINLMSMPDDQCLMINA